MGSCSLRTKLKELQTRCAQLERQAKQLQEEKQRAAYTETLLSSICDLFTMVQISNGLRVVGTQDDVHYSEHSRDRVNQLLQQESSLLSQLTVVPAKPVPETLGVPVLGVTTAAPRTDPLALLKYCLCQDVPDAGTVTSKQLAQSLSVVVLECSVQLHLLQRPDVPAAQSCTDRMRELWLRHLTLMAAVTMSARPEVVDGICTYNLATLQQDPEAMQKQQEQGTFVPGLLDLTDEQVQEIVAGHAVFVNLQNSILQELQQLQAKVMAKTRMSDESSSPSDGSGCSTHLVSSTKPCCTHDLSLHGILGELEQHMRHTDRIQLLLHKEMTVRAAAVAWLTGCLDWRQITKASILCWPYAWRVSAFGQAVSQSAACRGGSQQGKGQGHRHGHSSSSSGGQPNPKP